MTRAQVEHFLILFLMRITSFRPGAIYNDSH